MALTIRNILVGAGNLYVSAVDNVKTALPAAPSAGTSYNVALDGATATWRHVGATREGLEMSYEPDYADIEVDQLKDAAMLFNTGISISVTTSMVEATLQNLLLAWGQPSTALVSDTLSIADPLETPVERNLAIVGRAPATAVAPTARRERVYFARRVISVEGSAHSMERTDPTVFPVTFRLLPDPTYAGTEYGTIIDRTI